MKKLEIGDLLLYSPDNTPVILRDELDISSPTRLIYVEPEKSYIFWSRKVASGTLAPIPLSSPLAENLPITCKIAGLIRIEKLTLHGEDYMISGYGRIGKIKWPLPKVVRFVHEVQQFLRSEKDDFSEMIYNLGDFNKTELHDKSLSKPKC